MNCRNSLSQACCLISRSRVTQAAYSAADVEHLATRTGYALRRSLALRTDSIALLPRRTLGYMRNLDSVVDEGVVKRLGEEGQQERADCDELKCSGVASDPVAFGHLETRLLVFKVSFHIYLDFESAFVPALLRS